MGFGFFKSWKERRKGAREFYGLGYRDTEVSEVGGRWWCVLKVRLRKMGFKNFFNAELLGLREGIVVYRVFVLVIGSVKFF